MLFLLSLLLSAPSHACDVLGYQGAQLVQVGEVVGSEVHAFRGGQFVTVGRLVGGLIQRLDGTGQYVVAGKYSGADVYAFSGANQFALVGKTDGDKILALTGTAYTPVGASVSCLPWQAAAGGLLLLLRPVN